LGLLALLVSPPELEGPPLAARIAPAESAPSSTETTPSSTASTPAPTVAPEGAATTGPKREWMLVIAPGFDYLIGPKNVYRALGGGGRFGAHAIKWAGKRGRFLVGGGPIVHYTYFRDTAAQDTLHLATLNGDLLLGGGNQRFGVYWHATIGFGYLQAVDGATDSVIRSFGARMASGVGVFGKIVDRFSLGVLVDVGWAGGVWINPLLTANIHFGRRGDPL
jgi:hypothetical protein